MRIARVVLQNVKSYADATSIPLAPGINAVCGENGAGKSTILEAIGFALFGYRPYRLDAFLREGEKSGSITVTVEDDDGCGFHVVRKLGSGAGQAVYDELNQRIAEGEADVRNWLLDFFRLEPGTDLAKLFEDTVGPPQGTLTAIFLESAAPRAKKFDRLLGIEDYQAAAQTLRSVSNLFRDQATEAERRAALLEGDARRLPEMEQRQVELLRRKAELAVGLAHLGTQHRKLKEALEGLETARQAAQRAQSDLEQAEGRMRDAERWRQEREAEVRRAEEAARLVQQSAPGYQAYLEAAERLRGLNERRKARDRLRQEAEAAAKNALRWDQGVRAGEERLAGLEKDEARAAERQLLIPEQERREEAVRRAEERVRAREQAARQQPAVEERLRAAEALLREAEAELARVEQARPLAARLEELSERERELREQSARLEKDIWTLKQTDALLAEAEGRLRELDAETALLRAEVEKLQPQKSLAALAFARQQERDSASAEVASLETRYQEARRSRGQVQGGLCPFLHEPCRNLRPGVTLDGYFDALIEQVGAELEGARSRLDEAEEELGRARAAEQALVRLPDLEARIGQLAEGRSRLHEEIGRLRGVRAELEAAPREQTRLREALEPLEQELSLAEAASRVVSAEAGWRRQSEEAAQAMERERQALAEIGALLEREDRAEESLAAARRDLAELGDPRAEAAALRARIARERPEAERALEYARSQLERARAAEERARGALEPYATLEEELEVATSLRDANEPAYQAFLANRREAESLPQRRAALQKATAETEQAAAALDGARQALERVRAAYDEAQHLGLRREAEEVAGRIASGQRELELCEQEEQRLLRELNALRQRRAEMEVAQREAAECRELMGVVETIRRALDAAGPEIARALLRRISARATGIYRDLLGQPTVSLEWGSDYEIRCRVRAEEREFKQLSGGEQMAAALAVRLALLQTISNLRLAFLDEPTAHMDTQRRVNLAAQIQNLRSFDQLVVISHDDSFDTLFGHVVRLAKRDGATVVED